MNILNNHRFIISHLMSLLYERHGIEMYIGVELEFVCKDNDKVEMLSADLMRMYGLKVIRERMQCQYEIIFDATNQIEDLIVKYNECKSYIVKQLGEGALNAISLHDNKTGSAMQLNISLHRGEENLYCSPGKIIANKYILRSVSGILHLLEESIYLITQRKDSIDRLSKSSDINVPKKISWGINNRTTAIRVTNSKMQIKNTQNNYNASNDQPYFSSPNRLFLLHRNKRLEFRVPSACDEIQMSTIFLLMAIEYAFSNDLGCIGPVYGNVADNMYHLPSFPSSLEKAEKIFKERGKVLNYLARYI